MMEHINFFVTSVCLKLVCVAVHLYQSKLCSFHSDKFKDLMKIYSFTDGAALQYKNKNFYKPLLSQK
jgi:hypothetical protein